MKRWFAATFLFATLCWNAAGSGTPSSVNIRSVGATGDGVSDDTAAISSALESASPGSTIVFPAGLYAISSGLVVNNRTVQMDGATITFTGQEVANVFEITGGGAITGNGNIVSARRNWNATKPQTAILLSGSNGRLQIDRIDGFEYGVSLIGSGVGAAYNSVYVREIRNCIRSINLDAVTVSNKNGWVNQNYVQVDRQWITTDKASSDPKSFASSYGIYIDSHSSYTPNANRFSGCIEGGQTGLRLSGEYNRLEGLRFELQPGYRAKVDIEPATGKPEESPDYNWWFGECGPVDWATDVIGSAKNERALIGFGVIGLPEYNEWGYSLGPFWTKVLFTYDVGTQQVRLDQGDVRSFTVDHRDKSFVIPTYKLLVGGASASLVGPGGTATAGDIFAGGQYKFNKTITGVGGTGAQTINKQAGTVRFAPRSQAIILTNSLVTTTTKGIATVQTDDKTAFACKFISAAGKATLKLNAPATAETEVYWEIRN